MTIGAFYEPITYVGNGSTTNFVITWKFFDEEVQVKDEYGVSYSGYKIINSENGGTVVFEVPPTRKVVITRRIPLNQSVDFNEGEDFPASDFEYSLDRLYMILQSMGYSIGKCLVLPEKFRDFDDFNNNIVRVRYNKSSLNAPFEWGSNTSYDVHDVCLFNGGLYINTLPANKGTAPSSSNSGWVKLATSSYTSTEIDTKLDNKANKSDVFTIEQTITRLDLKADKTSLDDKADKSSVYTKAEVDGLIGDIGAILDNVNGEVV